MTEGTLGPKAASLARLRQAGGRLLVTDAVFLYDPALGLFAQRPLQPHETRRPASWSLLTARLETWLRPPHDLAGALGELAGLAAAEQAATLHVTHSWGGGVAQWVASFIDSSGSAANLQLRSEGPESGRGAGQRLSLYLGNRLDRPLAQWWLQPPIRSTAVQHPPYREILAEILARYGVGRLIVSSLVGHSLDALSAGLPTVQVLHDFYPRWPLLGVHPGPWLEPGKKVRLAAAIENHHLLPDFGAGDAARWERLGAAWLETVTAHGVRLVAPSRSVATMLERLDPDWAQADIVVIPHGLPALPGAGPVAAHEREDGRLRLLIPGRMQEGKGQKLLLEALPGLRPHAQVYLLGAGQEAAAFFGKAGVNVVIQYDREDLPERLGQIGPHLAALLSVVPETFSYTLSEMQLLGIPVIATRVGSLAERIEDGSDGWLIEPQAEALVERIKALSRERSLIGAMRKRLQSLDPPRADGMVACYDELCPPTPPPYRPTRIANLETAQHAAEALRAVELAGANREFQARAKQLQLEVEKRSAWAEEREQARLEEEIRRKKWVAELEGQLDERFRELQSARDAFEREQDEHAATRAQLAQIEFYLAELKALHEWVLSTRSWRFTRPLRVADRLLAKLSQLRAWNPERWPFLLSQLLRTVKTGGLRSALMKSQHAQFPPHRPAEQAAASIMPVGPPEAPARLPQAGEPDVSIVIPVYNKWVYTAACLRSLAETRSAASFEVIVVDDQSSDETADRLGTIEGLVRVRNEQNAGFIASCNRGAELARGRYLVLLNNDTQVTDGWLDALIATFGRHPDTGLAGARLIYPDGSLQEDGGIVFRDGSGWNYGKGDLADRPEYLYTREADYCSGACIMLETRLFRELGGFDDRYTPAYYEDTDLAFRVREHGLTVRVQPAATIIHHEGVSSGTDIASGTKRYQAVNQKTFLERWQDVLQQHPAPISDPSDAREVRRARDHRLKGHILVIDAYTPEPDQDSGSLRLRHLMDCLLTLGYGVSFMPDNRAHAGRYTTALQQAGIEALYEPWVESPGRFFDRRGSEFDYVMISRHYVAANYLALLRRHCPQAKFIFDTVDLHYLREQRMAELEDSLPLKRTAAATRRAELKVINAADVTLVVSPVEKTVLANDAPGAAVRIVSNVHEVVGSQRPFAERKDLFFVGGYQHPPNIDAALWFVGTIWPLIRKELPEAEFHLIGSKAPEQVRALHGNGVRFHGFVKQLEPWLDGCRLAVAPLRYGAGVKGKVNLSMSRGQPVVATPMAVEGLFAEPGRDILVADSPQDFAAAVVRLYRDEALWNRLSLAGLENVRRYFSVETARLSLQQMLKSL
ncbi:MAG: glycosyltransferase [Xanthomonadales bacterium]|nr:glycosyltransferase [Xanthomonadales bacterium]